MAGHRAVSGWRERPVLVSGGGLQPIRSSKAELELLPVDVGFRHDPALAILAREPAFLELLRGTGAFRRYASVWRENPSWEAVGIHGLFAVAHLDRCRELAEQGYRPMALSVAELAGERGPLAASVWLRPALTPAEKEQKDRHKGMAGAALLRLEPSKAEEVWPLWRHGPDPTVRSYLVERVGWLGVDPRLLVRRLQEEKDVSARRALIVALGEYTDKECPPSVRVPLVKRLLSWYRDDPDPGVHGAIDWLLRHGQEGPSPRPLDWGQKQELQRIDRDLARRDPEGKHGWYVNRQGQSFTLIRGPVEFLMGSPHTEPDRNVANEKPHLRVIPRSYAIAGKPVTVAEYERFLADRPQHRNYVSKRSRPEAEGPMVGVSWFSAAAYCNWLSEKEGIPKDQWCYPEEDVLRWEGKHVADIQRRTGYRLPTEAEWEYACRAGAATSRYYGSSAALLPRYAVIAENSQRRPWPAGQKRPNDIGLFDMHGHVQNWCHGLQFQYPTNRAEDTEYFTGISQDYHPSMRGASFVFYAWIVRSAYRHNNLRWNALTDYGLRVCRTYNP